MPDSDVSLVIVGGCMTLAGTLSTALVSWFIAKRKEDADTRRQMLSMAVQLASEQFNAYVKEREYMKALVVDKNVPGELLKNTPVPQITVIIKDVMRTLNDDSISK